MTTATTPPDREPLSGRRVLVTGASAGIGEATARALAARGARVALLARRADRLAELVAELPGAVAVPVDLTDDAAAAAVHTAADALGGLDAVVNAAGVFHAGTVTGDGADAGDEGAEHTTPDQWRRMFELNVVALLVVTRAAAGHLGRGTAPAVVNLSSMSGRRVPTAAGAVYAASKHAVHAASEGPLRERFAERLATVGLDPAVVADGVVHVLSGPAQVVEYALTSVSQ